MALEALSAQHSVGAGFGVSCRVDVGTHRVTGAHSIAVLRPGAAGTPVEPLQGHDRSVSADCVLRAEMCHGLTVCLDRGRPD